MKILLAPWGDPTRWSEISYSMDGKKIKSISTLSILSKKYDKVIILAMDSLIDIRPDKRSYLYDEYMETIAKIQESGIKGYGELVESVHNFIKLSLKKIGIGNSEIVVLPSFGSPGGGFRFEGSPEDYVSVGLWKIEKIIENAGEDIEEVSIDLTNGMNFITALTTNICNMVTDIELMRNSSHIKIITEYFNSDPYSPSLKDGDFYIRSVSKIIKDRIDLPYLTIMTDSKKFLGFKSTESDLRVDINETNRNYSKIVPNVLKAIYYPLPLVLKYYANKSIKENILDIWESGITVSNSKIKRNVFINPNKLYGLLFTNLVCGKIEQNRSIESISKDSRLIYQKISALSQVLINKEINNIKERALEKLKTSGKESDLYRNLITGEFVKDPEPDKRILIAHAGFQNDFTRIHRDGRLEYTIDVKEILKKIGT